MTNPTTFYSSMTQADIKREVLNLGERLTERVPVSRRIGSIDREKVFSRMGALLLLANSEITPLWRQAAITELISTDYLRER